MINVYVIDGESYQPITDATVDVGGKQAMTDETGLARVDGPANATVAAWHADGLSPQAAPTGPTGP